MEMDGNDKNKDRWSWKKDKVWMLVFWKLELWYELKVVEAERLRQSSSIAMMS